MKKNNITKINPEIVEIIQKDKDLMVVSGGIKLPWGLGDITVNIVQCGCTTNNNCTQKATN